MPSESPDSGAGRKDGRNTDESRDIGGETGRETSRSHAENRPEQDEAGESDRYEHVNLHLCKECGDEFTPGDEVVSLSDGYVTGKSEYEVKNRRIYHRDCWAEQ